MMSTRKFSRILEKTQNLHDGMIISVIFLTNDNDNRTKINAARGKFYILFIFNFEYQSILINILNALFFFKVKIY